jgi:hypothetical protein
MSSTIRVEESVQIARSPTEVWDAIADYAFDFEWRKGLREMAPDPPGPPAQGTQVHGWSGIRAGTTSPTRL